MRSTATLKWIGLALLGIAIAAAVAVAASGLVSREIGLASEPVLAGDALAPSAARHPASGPDPSERHGGSPSPERTTQEAAGSGDRAAPSTPSPAPSPAPAAPQPGTGHDDGESEVESESDGDD